MMQNLPRKLQTVGQPMADSSRSPFFYAFLGMIEVFYFWRLGRFPMQGPEMFFGGLQQRIFNQQSTAQHHQSLAKKTSVHIRVVQFFNKSIDSVSNMLFVPYPIRRGHSLTVNEWAFIGRAPHSRLQLPGIRSIRRMSNWPPKKRLCGLSRRQHRPKFKY